MCRVTNERRDAIVAYLRERGGARTYYVVNKMNIITQTARRDLDALERDGRVKRSDRYSAVNCIYWIAVDG